MLIKISTIVGLAETSFVHNADVVVVRSEKVCVFFISRIVHLFLLSDFYKHCSIS